MRWRDLDDAGGIWRAPMRSVIESGGEEWFQTASHHGWPVSATAVRLSTRYPVGVILRYSHWDTLRAWAAQNGMVLGALAAATAAVIAALGFLLRDALRRARLQAQVRLLFHAVHQSPMVVVITDARGSILYVNPAFTSLLGYAPAEVIGRNPRFFRSRRTPGETHESLWATIVSGRPWTGEFFNRRKDGGVVHVSSTISAVRDASGVTRRYVGMMADIGEIKRIEREREALLVRLDRAHADLRRFAEVSAHHLQEPTRRLVSFAQRLRSRLIGRQNDPDVEECLSFIESQAIRLRALVRDVQLYLAADQPLGEPRIVHPEELAAQAAARLAKRIKEAGATVDIAELPSIRADASRLQEIFVILIDNALRHGGATGARISVAGERVKDRARFRVMDRGPGIPEEYRERVFRVFERLNSAPGDDSSGIGLAIVRRIVEAAGGTVEVEETPGGGATIVFELPDPDPAP